MVLARRQSWSENPVLLGLTAFTLFLSPLTNVACVPVRGVRVERGKGGGMRTGKRLERRMGKTGMDIMHVLTETRWQPEFFPNRLFCGCI